MLGIYRDVWNIRDGLLYTRFLKCTYYFPKIRYLRSKSKYLIIYIYRPVNIVVLGLLTLCLEKPIHTVLDPKTQICPMDFSQTNLSPN